MQFASVGRARAKWSAADALASNGKLEEAERTLLEAKAILESQEPESEPDKLLFPNILSSLSLIQKKLNKHEKVLTTLKLLLRVIIERRLSKLDHAITVANIGTTLFFLGKADVSLTYTLKANKMLERISSPASVMQPAEDNDPDHFHSMPLEERRRLLVTQVPACYNLAIIYHHLGCALESNRCLHAAKTLAISKIGFNHRITDLVTKNVEMKNKDGRPIFLALHFTLRSLGLDHRKGGSKVEILEPEREMSSFRLAADTKSRQKDHKNNLKVSKFATAEDDNPSFIDKERDSSGQRLPKLNQERTRNPVLRPNAAVQKKMFQGVRPQTDNADWNPAFNANYAQFGMQRVINSGRPLGIGEAVGLRVNKLPSIYDKNYFPSLEAGSFDSEANPGGFQAKSTDRNHDQIGYDILRIESSKSHLPERDPPKHNRATYDQQPLKKSQLKPAGIKAASFSEEPKPKWSGGYEQVPKGTSQDRQTPFFSKQRESSKVAPPAASNKKKALQPMVQMSHFGFNETVIPENEKSYVKDSFVDSPSRSKLFAHSPSPIEEVFAKKYRPIGGSRPQHEQLGHTKKLDIDRLQINMRYLG